MFTLFIMCVPRNNHIILYQHSCDHYTLLCTRWQFIERCLRYIQKLAAINDSILHHGDKLAVCLRTVIDSAHGELSQRALTSFEPLMSAWHEMVVRQLATISSMQSPTPESILAVVQAVYSIERCRRPFLKKGVLLSILDWTRFSAAEYLTWYLPTLAIVLS